MRVLVRRQRARVRLQHMPTSDEIRARATELFMEAQRRITGEIPPSTPEDAELKSDGFWDQARNELMRGEENPALRRLLEDVETLRDMGISEAQIKTMLEQSGITMERVQRGVSKEKAKELEFEIGELEKEVERLKTQIPAPDQQDELVRIVERWIHTKAVENELSPADEAILRTAINRRRSLADNEMALDMEIASLVRERKEKAPKPKVPPTIQPFSGNATGAFGFPFGQVRVRRVRIPPRIPAVCTTVQEFAHLEDARKEALSRKLRTPDRHLGYAFDPDKHVWATIDCTIVPEAATLDNDSLVVLPVPERFEREEGPTPH